MSQPSHSARNTHPSCACGAGCTDGVCTAQELGEHEATTAEALSETVARVTTLVNHYHRDAPFRAPETVPEWQARLLNDVWTVLGEAQESASSARSIGATDPLIYALLTEVARQDEKHGPFEGTELGRSRLAIACLEDEVEEARDAWRGERKGAVLGRDANRGVAGRGRRDAGAEGRAMTSSHVGHRTGQLEGGPTINWDGKQWLITVPAWAEGPDDRVASKLATLAERQRRTLESLGQIAADLRAQRDEWRRLAVAAIDRAELAVLGEAGPADDLRARAIALGQKDQP
jgi:hypothetical protein